MGVSSSATTMRVTAIPGAVPARAPSNHLRTMCARFSLAGPERIADRYPQFKLRNAWPRRYNIAPTQEVLAARNDGEREIAPLRWGLVPFWARDLGIGQ